MIGVDLFAGAGGMSWGATKAGIAVKYAVEQDPFAAETYTHNHSKTKVHCGDIRRLPAGVLSEFRKNSSEVVVFGGPPCQGFSWSNVRTRNPQNEGNWLFEEFLRIVGIIRPAWVVFENVRGIVDTDQGSFLTQIQSGLSTFGYHLSSAVLNAMDYGVPQNRTRFFLVGSQNGIAFRFPRVSTPVPLTVEEAIRDLPRLENGNGVCWQRYGRAYPSDYGAKMRGRLIGCSNHLITRNARFVVRRYKHVPQGGNWENIPDRLMRNYKDRFRCHTGIYHRLRSRKPSVVIGNYRKNMLIHPEQDRGLSVREAARIQSFPDSYEFHGSIGFQQQQVGNAVPPLLAMALFQAVVNQHEENA